MPTVHPEIKSLKIFLKIEKIDIELHEQTQECLKKIRTSYIVGIFYDEDEYESMAAFEFAKINANK